MPEIDNTKNGYGSDFIEAVLSDAGFDKNDEDMATCGLCGTFALAVKSVFPEVGFALICLNDKNENPKLDRDGELMWRHVVVTCHGNLLDIHGNKSFDDLVTDFCWGNLDSYRGSLVEVDENKLLSVLHAEKNAFDQPYLDKWTRMLEDCRMKLQSCYTERESASLYAVPRL